MYGCLPARAPALPSSVTCHVKASPRAFSDSSSLVDLGKALRHSSNIRGKCCFTTGGPSTDRHSKQSYSNLLCNKFQNILHNLCYNFQLSDNKRHLLLQFLKLRLRSKNDYYLRMTGITFPIAQFQSERRWINMFYQVHSCFFTKPQLSKYNEEQTGTHYQEFSRLQICTNYRQSGVANLKTITYCRKLGYHDQQEKVRYFKTHLNNVFHSPNSLKL